MVRCVPIVRRSYRNRLVVLVVLLIVVLGGGGDVTGMALLPTANAAAGAAKNASSSSFRRTLRWVVGGIGAELYHNLIRRPMAASFARVVTPKLKPQDEAAEANNQNQNTQNDMRDLAIVTGATGGIGREICRGLIERNYDVLLLARNVQKGEQLAAVLNQDTVKTKNTSSNHTTTTRTSRATFVEYHADRSISSRKNPKNPTTHYDDDTSLAKLRTAIGDRGVAVLVNNAAIMGKTYSQQETLEVNLVAPTVLTFALIPFLQKSSTASTTAARFESAHCTITNTTQPQRRRPVVVNVGSSSHLRAEKVHPEYLLFRPEQGQPNAETETPRDTNLEAYAQSKLGLMQVANIVQATYSSWLSVNTAHPGLVWTPLLQTNFPGAQLFEHLGLAHVVYKTPREGAATIFAAIEQGRQEPRPTTSLPPPPLPPPAAYFVNAQPSGYASPESQDRTLSQQLWHEVLRPLVDAHREIPDEVYQEVCNKHKHNTP